VSAPGPAEFPCGEVPIARIEEERVDVVADRKRLRHGLAVDHVYDLDDRHARQRSAQLGVDPVGEPIAEL
jgi:hypothetical protein